MGASKSSRTNALYRLFLRSGLGLVLLLPILAVVGRPALAQSICDFRAIGAAEQAARVTPPTANMPVDLVIVRLETAARSLRTCANASVPVAPRYKLRLEAVEDWELQLRLLAAEHPGASDDPITNNADWEITVLRLIAIDPEAPVSVRNSARDKQHGLCTTPYALNGRCRICQFVRLPSSRPDP